MANRRDFPDEPLSFVRYRALKDIAYSVRVLSLVLIPALASCTGVEVDKVRALNPDVPPLSQQLHLQYGSLALRKNAEGNVEAARHFVAKASSAAEGAAVMPDMPGDDEGEQVYRRLSSFLTQDRGEMLPAVKARAQVMFDCWLEERTSGNDAGDIKACKQELEKALIILNAMSASRGVMQ